MWSCHKCGKPVYFAERKQSLGYDWHPECLRCEECGKRLNPGQHAEHKGVPYCHIPCYGALFGPTLFGHGSQVESHKSFGKVENRPGTPIERSHLEAKLKLFNQYYDGKSQQLNSRERNGKLILEGILRIYWGVNKLIHLKENHDQRTRVQVRKRNSCRIATNYYSDSDDSDSPDSQEKDDCNAVNGNAKLAVDHITTVEHNSADENCSDKLQQPKAEAESQNSLDVEQKDLVDSSQTQCLIQAAEKQIDSTLQNSKPTVVISTFTESEQAKDNKKLIPFRVRKMASSRLKSKLKRRCSINGHFYNRETSVFTLPVGSASNVWVSSMVNGPEVINMLLEKFCIENNPQEFALFVVRDNGESRRILDHEYPLLVRVVLGPHEDVAKLFIMDKLKTNEISSEVAQFLNLSDTELNAIIRRYHEEEEREVKKIKRKYREMKRLIHCRIAELQLKLNKRK